MSFNSFPVGFVEILKKKLVRRFNGENLNVDTVVIVFARRNDNKNQTFTA